MEQAAVRKDFESRVAVPQDLGTGLGKEQCCSNPTHWVARNTVEKL